MMCRSPARRPRTGVSISLASSRARPLARTVKTKNLNSPVKRIDHKNPVLRINRETGGQLELSHFWAPSSEVIEQVTLAIEDLHHAPQCVHDVQVAFGVDSDSFRTKRCAGAVSNTPNRKLELSRPIENLNAKVHGVDHDQIGAIQA